MYENLVFSKNNIFEDYKLILNSCLFDKNWYSENYFKDTEKFQDPIYHYLIKGADLGYNPNPYFETRYYLEKNKDVKNAKMNPLIHYIKYGKKEGRIFSQSFSLKNLSLEEELFYNFENHELINGVRKIIELNLFDSKYYLSKYKDVKDSNVNPLIHYIKLGSDEFRNPSESFNTNYYSKHSDVKKRNMLPLIHYALIGIDKKGDAAYSINPDEKFHMINSKNQINYLYKRINFLEQKINNQNAVIDNHQEYFNFIYQYKDIKAIGIQRNVQLHVLGMLKFIIKLCEKNNLVYWLDSGTLIGALRHKGFIPWDDEVDMCMPRKDCEILIKIILDTLEENKELNEIVYLRKPFSAFRETKTIDKTPCPEIQFVNRVPFANVDIHISDYYDINLSNIEPIYRNANFYRNARDEFASIVKKGEYDNLEETYKKYCEKAGISFEETEFLGASLDSAFKTPLHVTEIFPLKKVPFEGLELNAPHDPFNYLYNTYYREDVMKLPKLIEDHNRKDIVANQLKNKNIDEEYKKIIAFWDNLSNEI